MSKHNPMLAATGKFVSLLGDIAASFREIFPAAPTQTATMGKGYWSRPSRILSAADYH